MPLRRAKAKQKPPPPSLATLVSKVHELARNTANMGIPSPHLHKRMAQRGRVMRDVLETVQKGEGISGPTLDAFGDWRIKLRRLVGKRRVQVVVAVREDDFSIVTVI